MKPLVVALTLMLGVGVAYDAAAQFNTDALKKIQKEGHKLADKARGIRVLKYGTELCLDSAGGLALKKCDDEAKTQKWTADEADRLVADNGQCLAGNRLAKCGEGDAQVWRQDEQGRLLNKAKQCLQVNQTRVITAACSDAKTQIWGRPVSSAD